VKELYKFRPCRAPEEIERVKTLLLGKLWFSAVKEFNDPFEARPRFAPRFSEPSLQTSAILAYAQEACRRHSFTSEQAAAFVREISARTTDGWLYDTTELWKELPEECFVFSMSSNRAHPLQWSHYAKDHTGVCVHLDATQAPISLALRVDYSDEYPTILMPPSEGETDKNAIAVALRKAAWWDYEHEFRIVGFRGSNPGWHMGMNWEGKDNRAAVCSPGVCTGITFGARMGVDEREALSAWCRANRPDLQIEVADLAKTTFALDFRPYLPK
jgi:hypothetical protein